MSALVGVWIIVVTGAASVLLVLDMVRAVMRSQ